MARICFFKCKVHGRAGVGVRYGAFKPVCNREEVHTYQGPLSYFLLLTASYPVLMCSRARMCLYVYAYVSVSVDV